MKKIVLLPLDERPCNYDFPYKLFQSDEFQIVRPKELGDKKTPGDIQKIREFLLEECKDAYGLIVSVDTLLYGGLIPSRLHKETVETLKGRLEVFKELKEANPQLKTYAFTCIMRCPSYSNADEEPDYYDDYGTEIHKIGIAKHKMILGMDTEENYLKLRSEVPEEVLADFEGRRVINRELIKETIFYYKNGYIDALVIPQDDSAPLGYTAIDQQEIRSLIQKECLTDEVILYSGADEVALSLAARLINDIKGVHPKVYVKYATEAAKMMIPRYEGVRLGTTIGFHILSAGCIQVDDESQADILMVVTAPDNMMEESFHQPSISPNYNAERNMAEVMRYVVSKLAEGKRVAITDNAYSNGGELDLIRMMNKHGILMDVCAYAGWNTNGNTLGTVMAEAVYDFHFGVTPQKQDFLVERYLEDMAYCGHVRGNVTKQIAGTELFTFATKEIQDQVAAMVKDQLVDFANEYMTSIADKVTVKHVSMPWKRMFEVRLDASYNE